MQVTFLLNTIESALESYCPAKERAPLCAELGQMGQSIVPLLEQVKTGRVSAAAAAQRLGEMRSREKTIEIVLGRQRWDEGLDRS